MGVFQDSWNRWRPMVSERTEIALTAFGLGFVAAVSFTCIALHLFAGASAWVYAFGAYLFTVVAVFHMSEFVVAAEYRPHDASPRSFMIFHSPAFLIANGVAWFEFVVCGCWLRLSYHPEPTTASVTFFTLVALGSYAVRVLAMVQCGSNFALMVETSKRPQHRLVTHGVYAYLRHPSYFGWFWYAITTQLIALNPVCFVLFVAASWYFFNDRIRDEEAILASERFFGAEYVAYRKRTSVGIPWIG
uniref:Protein-S-isoprenylcysteine O-methyltransferase n=1 Tax=Neobodo designis TaxID=312471 RepID=A0A7S1QYP4_NEODS